MSSYNEIDGFKNVNKEDLFPNILKDKKPKTPKTVNPEDLEKRIIEQSTEKDKKSKKGLIDILLTHEIKVFIASTLTIVTIMCVALGIITYQTQDINDALRICSESVSVVLESRGIISTDEDGNKMITSLDNFSKLVLDSPEDYYLYTHALQDAKNFNDAANGLSEYEIKNKVATYVLQANGRDHCLDARQVCTYFGYNNEIELINDVINKLTKEYKDGKLDGYLISELGSRGGTTR